MGRSSKISSRNRVRPPPPAVPAVTRNNNSNGSMVGSMASGVASGFGFGTGMEVAKGIGSSIFGSKEVKNMPPSYQGDVEKDRCKMLSEMVLECQQVQKIDNFTRCDELLQLFSKACFDRNKM